MPFGLRGVSVPLQTFYAVHDLGGENHLGHGQREGESESLLAPEPFDGLQLLFALGEEFYVEIPDDAAKNYRSVNEVVKGLGTLLVKNAGVRHGVRQREVSAVGTIELSRRGGRVVDCGGLENR